MVQCRGVRMDADAVPGAGGGPGGNRGSEPLFRYAPDRARDQPHQRLLAFGVCDEGRQGKDLALSWSRGMAGRRRGVVGSHGAPRARRPGQLAAHHGDRGKKCAGLSRHRERIGSWRRAAFGNPLLRIRTACASCSTRRRFAPRCRRSSYPGTLHEPGSRRSRGLSSDRALPCLGQAFSCSSPSSGGGAAQPPAARRPRTLPMGQGNPRSPGRRACCWALNPARRC